MTKFTDIGQKVGWEHVDQLIDGDFRSVICPKIQIRGEMILLASKDTPSHCVEAATIKQALYLGCAARDRIIRELREMEQITPDEIL